MMKKRFPIYAFFLMAALLTACQSAVDESAIEDELARIEALLHANDTLLLKSDSAQARSIPPEEAPSPLDWSKYLYGSGPYKPSTVNYLELVDEYGEYGWGDGEDPGYNHYVFFEFGIDNEMEFNAEDYLMQVQYAFTSPLAGDLDWEYIHMPDNEYGLVEILGPRRLDYLPAYAFPYCNNGQDLYVRIRTVQKDFITSEPDLEEDKEWMYDYNMFSPWEVSYGWDYYNPFGFGKPQPDQHENVNAEPDDPIIDDSNIQVTVHFPVMDLYSDEYSFSYTVTNNNMGYTEILNQTQTNSLGIGKNVISNIGNKGGFIEVFATCTNKYTKEYAYCNKIIEYGPSEKNIIVEFYGYDFDDFFDPDDDDW